MLNQIVKIYFVRHGLVENPDKISYGRLPGFPLSQIGREQIAASAEHLASESLDQTQILASPLLRAVETAEIIAARLNHIKSQPIFDERLTEIRQPYTQGMTMDEYWNIHDHGLLPANPELQDESYTAVGNRVLNCLNSYAAKNFIIISHQDTIRFAVGHLCGLNESEARNLPLDTGGIYQVINLNGKWEYKLVN